MDKLEANGVALRILDFSGNAVDTRGATGRLMLNMRGIFLAGISIGILLRPAAWNLAPAIRLLLGRVPA